MVRRSDLPPAQVTGSVTRYTIIESLVGPLLLADAGAGIERLAFRGQPAADWVEDAAAFRDAARQLELYFAGKLREFTLKLAPEGTPFQRQVWRELLNIPYGQTISYGELARRIGHAAGAARAVGLANGANPVAILIPCHRVIGASGKLTGFSGGLDVKRRLLELERGKALLAGS